jgi:hypothetical protein
MTAFRAALPVILTVALLLSGCDQLGNRYEISKDQKGRTVRLDKRTGEIAIVEDDKIILVKDAKDLEGREKQALDRVGKFKYWPPQDLKQFNIQVNLTTVWRDGKLFYAVEFRPSSPKLEKAAIALKEKNNGKNRSDAPVDAEKIIRAIMNRRFDLILEDTPFELAKERLNFSLVVSDKSRIIGQDAKGHILMSRETYDKIDVWNIHWY